jgi:hypothetical protein
VSICERQEVEGNWYPGGTSDKQRRAFALLDELTMAVKEVIWDAMLQHIIKGMANNGSRKWSRITPETG